LAIVGKETIKTTVKAVPGLAGRVSEKWMRLEDQIMERALVLWHKKGRSHRNALKALLQARREILIKNHANPTRRTGLEQSGKPPGKIAK
jgi:hypothetical protein